MHLRVRSNFTSKYASHRLEGEWFSFTREELDRAISPADAVIPTPKSALLNSDLKSHHELRAMLMQLQDLSLTVRVQGIEMQELRARLDRTEPKKKADDSQVIPPVLAPSNDCRQLSGLMLLSPV